MKIISKYNDYYDGISKSFYDDEILFNRKFELIQLPSQLNKNSLPNLYKLVELGRTANIYYNYRTENPTTYDKCILGFCGKLYQIYLKKDEVDFVLIEANHKKSVEKLTTYYFDDVNKVLDLNDYFSKGTIAEITNESNFLFNLDFNEIFIELDTPIFLFIDYKSNTFKIIK